MCGNCGILGSCRAYSRDFKQIATADTVTVIWVSPCFGYPHTQIPSEMGGRDTQNTDSYTDKRLEEAKVILDIKAVFLCL